jgi:hypothetical protein
MYVHCHGKIVEYSKVVITNFYVQMTKQHLLPNGHFE